MEGTRLFSSAGRSQLNRFPVAKKKKLSYSILSPMLFRKLAGLFLLSFTIIVVACPIPESAIESDGLEARSPFWNGKVDPNRKTCKRVWDCKCPGKQSTSCINGLCKCDDKTVNFFGNMFMKSIIAIGNAPVTKAIGNLMAGISDVKEVIGTILGSFLSPAAKASLKIALMALPDTGPSHIDMATKKVLTAAF